MNKFSKLVAGFVGITMALSMVVTPVTAGAQTQAELQAQIASLLAMIQSLQAKLANAGGSAGACSFTFTQNLTVGSTGAEVMNLQKFLNRDAVTQVAVSGAGSAGMETSYFGPATKAAVMKFQAKYASEVLAPAGLTSATGFWGASSRAKANAMCSVTVPPVVVPGTPTVPGDLEGTDGQISDVTELTTYSNEEVSEGDSEVKVMGFEVETTNDGDIALRSMRISLTQASTAASDNLDDYIDSVEIWKGSTKIGSADADDFSESSDVWTRTITVSNAVLKADTAEKFYVTVDAVNTIDSDDLDATWVIDLENIRYEDGSGVVTTYTDGEVDGMDVSIDFVDFSTAAETELNFSESNDSPEAGVVVVSDSGTTNNVVLLAGEIEVEGSSDVVIDELPFTFATTSSNFTAMVDSITLKIDGEEYSEAVSSITTTGATGTITFDDLDLTIEAGDTVEFELLADINDVDDFTEGATITASFSASNLAMVDAENEEGDQLTGAERNGTISGEAQTFRSYGIDVTLVSVDESANDAAGTFTIKYTIEAVGDDVYVSSLASASGYHEYQAQKAGVETTTGVSAVVANNTDSDLTAVGNYMIDQGEEETFTLTVSVTGGNGLFRAILEGIAWDTDDVATPAQEYTSNLDDFKTDYVTLSL